jgi:signal transduction histidine kinase/ActR/RegA family two-component response regulator/HAMP domain-containing protein
VSRLANLFQSLSIKRKLMLVIMGVSMVGLLFLSGAFIAYELFTFRQTMVLDLQTLAEIIGNQSTAALTFDDKAPAEEILNALRARRHVVEACVYKGNKEFAAYSSRFSPAMRPPVAPEPEGFRFQPDRLTLFHEIRLNGELIGTVYLESDLQELHERLKRYTQIIILFVLSSAVLTLLLSMFLQRIISRPIFDLADTARAVSTQRNYSLRAVKGSQDELGQLIDGFNGMLSQIQERDVALQKAHDKLEKRVAERTRDLQAEILERERAQQGLQQQLARISLLNQITQVIAERQDLSRILNAVLRQLEEHLTVDLGLICLHLPQSGKLRLAALRQKNAKQADKFQLHQDQEISLEESGLSQCITGKTVFLSDLSCARAFLPKQLAGAGLLCAVATPLMIEEKFFGLLLATRTAVESFSSGECEFLRMLGEQVALAAHQAHLHQQLETAYNELRQTQQAVMQQDRLRALGQMASGIAHDINNALSPVVGFSQMLLDYEPNLSPASRKQLTYIRTAGEDIAHIVARLREFYRRREGQEPLLALDLNHLVEQVVDMTRPRWRDVPQSTGIRLAVETQLESSLPQIIGTESELREALTNLILNSVDAMPQGGQLIVRTRLGGPASERNERHTHAIVEVIDTGAGMDEETCRRCLEPFFSTKGKRGTGMGLAMVYGVMERHEGRIEVLSELGKGTTMRLYLPLPKRTGAIQTEEVPAILPSPLKILCIDDEPVVRELLHNLLVADRHAVEVAESGHTGIELFYKALRTGPFDVVITDLGMPLMDGRQVATIIKSASPETPVLLLTGWGAFMRADGELPAHVDAILCKPPRAKELRETLCTFGSRSLDVQLSPSSIHA